LTPEEQEAQRRRGLDRANAIRTRRAELKRDLATGATTLTEVLRGDDEHLRTMKIRDLLLATPKLGAHKVQRLLNAFHFTSGTQLQGVPKRRREELLARIRTDVPSLRGMI
jgi:hypothetical protein